jgi:hypothetical protein
MLKSLCLGRAGMTERERAFRGVLNKYGIIILTPLLVTDV